MKIGAKILKNNAELLKTLYGNINDIVVEKDWNKLNQQLSKYDKMYEEQLKYYSFANKLAGVQMEDADMYNVSKEMNVSDPYFKESNAYKQYYQHYNDEFNKLKSAYETQGVTKTDAELQAELDTKVSNFTDYVSKDPALLSEITNNFMIDRKVPKSKEEIMSNMYKKAGMKPEDVEFFNTYQPLDPATFNRNMSKILLQNYPELISKGESGDTYAKLLQARLSGMTMGEIPRPEYEVKVDEKNGTIIYVDKKNPQNYKTVQYKEKPKEFTAEAVEKADDGTYWYISREWDATKNTFVKKRVSQLSNEEVEDYELSKETDKAKLTNLQTKGSGRRSLGSGRKKTTLMQQTVTQYLKDVATGSSSKYSAKRKLKELGLTEQQIQEHADKILNMDADEISKYVGSNVLTNTVKENSGMYYETGDVGYYPEEQSRDTNADKWRMQRRGWYDDYFTKLESGAMSFQDFMKIVEYDLANGVITQQEVDDFKKQFTQ